MGPKPCRSRSLQADYGKFHLLLSTRSYLQNRIRARSPSLLTGSLAVAGESSSRLSAVDCPQRSGSQRLDSPSYLQGQSRPEKCTATSSQHLRSAVPRRHPLRTPSQRSTQAKIRRCRSHGLLRRQASICRSQTDQDHFSRTCSCRFQSTSLPHRRQMQVLAPMWRGWSCPPLPEATTRRQDRQQLGMSAH